MAEDRTATFVQAMAVRCAEESFPRCSGGKDGLCADHLDLVTLEVRGSRTRRNVGLAVADPVVFADGESVGGVAWV